MTGQAGVGDLDDDGDLDAFVVNYYLGNRIFINGGSGTFTDSGQIPPQANSNAVSLADLDDDGDLDAFVTSLSDLQYVDGLPDKVWFNDGSGYFVDSGQNVDSLVGIDVDLGDVDGDGDIDALIANAHQAPSPLLPAQPNKLWTNDGSGYYSDSAQDLDTSTASHGALGDVDGDGDLDAIIFNRTDTGDGEPDKVFVNDGFGQFIDSGLQLGHSESGGGALGDLDMDGDLDIFAVSSVIPTGQPNHVWLNSTSVPVFLSHFQVDVKEDAVYVTWLVGEGAREDDFRLSAERRGERWDVPVAASSSRRFEA
jgi:hypothetical protein